MTRRSTRAWTASIVTAAALAGASLATVEAAPVPDVTFVTPAAHGVIDFGDPIHYELEGDRCDAAIVRVEVELPTKVLAGPTSRGCAGDVWVPTLATAATHGYVEGQALRAAVVSGPARVELTFMRLQVDDGAIEEGAPTVIESTDPRDTSAPGVEAVEMNTGDVMNIGRADLGSIYSVSIRSAIPADVESALWELRADDPTTGYLVAQGDLGHVDKSPANGGSFPDRWYMLTFRAPPLLPAAGSLPEGAHDLFFRITAAASPVLVNWIDLNGTGARDSEVSRLTPDPAGTVVLFDGNSGFAGWDECGWTIASHQQYDPDNVAMRADHVSASPNTLDASGCLTGPVAEYIGDAPAGFFQNVVLRLRFRLEQFEDNGGILLGGQEFQVHDRGEWFTGGYWSAGENCSDSVQFQTVLARTGLGPANSDCGYPADRIKGNTFPHWSEMEIIQNGPDYLVRVNGRDITRYHRADNPDGTPNVNPGDSLVLSNFFGTSNTIGPITDWDHVWYDDIRVYQCREPVNPLTLKSPDPACSTDTLLGRYPSP